MDIVAYFKNAENRILCTGFVPVEYDGGKFKNFTSKKTQNTCPECCSNYSFDREACPYCGLESGTFGGGLL